jgi:ankyrin repeat protein
MKKLVLLTFLAISYGTLYSMHEQHICGALPTFAEMVHLMIQADEISTLRDYGEDLKTAKDPQGNTPFHMAAKLGKKSVIDLLLSVAREIKNDKNNDGKSALDLAEDDAIKELLQP